MRSLNFVVEGDVRTQVVVTEQSDGTLLFEIDVLGDGLIGDLRGLFFDVSDASKLQRVDVIGEDVKKLRVGDDIIDTVGGDANVKGGVSNASGKFDVGISFGTPGMSRDDIQSTSFKLSGLTIDDLSLQDFSLRYTSVGVSGEGRGDSSKILGQATAAPDAVLDEFETDEDASLLDANLLLNDTDADGDALAVNLVNGDSGLVGTPITVVTEGGRTAEITLAADGTLSFTPDETFDALAWNESDSFHFTYGVTDGNGGSDTEASATVTINGVNDDPVADDDSYVTDEDTAFTVLAANGVLEGDGDVDSPTLTVSAVNGVAASVGTQVTLDSGALVTLNADGSFDYDPNGQFDHLNEGEQASDSFIYTASDGAGGTDTATANLSINGVNDVPSFYEGTITAPGGGVGSLPLGGHYSSPSPSFSDYWSFHLEEGQTVGLQVNRMESDLDPALWIFRGTVTDPQAQFGAYIDRYDPGFVAFADDEIEHYGPYGDPYEVIRATEEGEYTAIVTNFASGGNTGGDGFFDYEILIT